ncbi:DUF456 domain-containing protein [Halobaculum sp. MBLA0143]|uniref:DUF456 domain-containing protein n=1 Tax=Halobaculum sp. MBLA0143 TaxID=3079933 RepID=UPI00352596A4
MFGLDLVGLLAVALVAAGVVGSLVPMAPGALLSLSGVYLYWWHTGFTEPGTIALAALTLVGLTTLAVDWLGGALAAEVSGAARSTTLLAGVAGVALLFVAGPVGVLVGVAGVVFLAELRGSEDPEESLRTALYTTAGMLASNLVQALLTGGMLVGFLLVVL